MQRRERGLCLLQDAVEALDPTHHLATAELQIRGTFGGVMLVGALCQTVPGGPMGFTVNHGATANSARWHAGMPVAKSPGMSVPSNLSRAWQRGPALAALAWVVGAGCGGQTNDSNAGAVGSAVGRVPEKHRAAAVACDDQRPPGGARALFQGSECAQDTDCGAGRNGRCQDFRGISACTYDECAVDAECSSSGPCACEAAFWSDANACLPGNCRTDADCLGGSGYCSPTFGDCGNYAGVIAYYCHAPEDTCIDDSDCTGDEARGSGYCMYRPELGHWGCGYGQCAG